MSNFLCEHCHTEIIDSEQGYVTSCAHYPILGRDCPAPVTVAMAREPGWLSRDCQLYTGKCSCPEGEERCRP